MLPRLVMIQHVLIPRAVFCTHHHSTPSPPTLNTPTATAASALVSEPQGYQSSHLTLGRSSFAACG
jgi:hypothetical protein